MQKTETTHERFPSFNKIAAEIANTHVSKRPKELKCEKQILQKGTETISKYSLLGNLTETKGIFSLDSLKERIEKEASNSQENWEIIWRSHIVS